jgi:hypothetical protein
MQQAPPMSTVLSALNPFATQKNKKQPMQGDPLMDGYLADQESAMSTLRFITEKNSVASSVVNGTPVTGTNCAGTNAHCPV